MSSTADSIATSKVVGKLQELGYAYSHETKKSRCYERGTDPVYLRKYKQTPEKAVRSVLSQAGCTPDEIERFLAACRG